MFEFMYWVTQNKLSEYSGFMPRILETISVIIGELKIPGDLGV